MFSNIVLLTGAVELCVCVCVILHSSHSYTFLTTFSTIFLPFHSLSHYPLSLSLRANLKLVRERSDYSAMGRTVGNLGNTYYLLGNYKKAIKYHEEVRR